MSKKWHSISLKGTVHLIPRICPATLRPATDELRYGYRGSFYLITRTTYYQTFYYAEDAAQAARACLKYRSQRLWLWVLIVIVLMPASFFGLAFASVSHPIPTFTLWLGPLICFGIGVAVNVWWRKKALARHPVPADAVGWGPSAYYTGTGLNLFRNQAVYKAQRPEWIRALVEANPGHVNDATYARVTGSARPQPDGSKPFA